MMRHIQSNKLPSGTEASPLCRFYLRKRFLLIKHSAAGAASRSPTCFTVTAISGEWLAPPETLDHIYFIAQQSTPIRNAVPLSMITPAIYLWLSDRLYVFRRPTPHIVSLYCDKRTIPNHHKKVTNNIDFLNNYDKMVMSVILCLYGKSTIFFAHFQLSRRARSVAVCRVFAAENADFKRKTALPSSVSTNESDRFLVKEKKEWQKDF